METENEVKTNIEEAKNGENSSVVGEKATEVATERKTNKKLSKKAKATIISVVAVILIILSWYLYQTSINAWDVKQEEITVEYGENVSLELADLVDMETYTKVTSDNTTIVDNFEYVNVESESEDGEKSDTKESYLEIGKYKIDVSHTIEYKLFSATVYSYEDIKQVSINVQDTTAPVFNDDIPAEIEVTKDCEIENLAETFGATDLTDVEITMDADKVDFATVGEYSTTVYATDTSNNETSVDITVKVTEPSITLDKTGVSLAVGETTNVKATVKGKDDTVTWSSSDESVATVDNGTITAVKAGTATITAKANDVEETVNVTVTKVTTSTSSSGSSSSSSSSNSGSSSKSSSSSSSSSSSNSSSNSSSSTTKKSETTTEKSTTQATCTNANNHSMSVGNIGKWFSSRSELESYVKSIQQSYLNQYDNGDITWDEYNVSCPVGYECWNCAYCGYWTGNFKYR